MFDAVKNSDKDFKNKTLLCLGGGCGRNADAIKNLGFAKVTNADIEPLHLIQGKKYYKDIEHIKLDRDVPVEGYDYFLYEDIFDEAYNQHTISNIKKWNTVSEHIISNYAYTVYKFNSKRLDQAFEQPEEFGNEYIKKKFGGGNLQVMADFSQVESLETEPCMVSLNDFKVNVDKVTTHTYQAIGQTALWLDNKPIGFKATLINDGLHQN